MTTQARTVRSWARVNEVTLLRVGVAGAQSDAGDDQRGVFGGQDGTQGLY